LTFLPVSRVQTLLTISTIGVSIGRSIGGMIFSGGSISTSYMMSASSNVTFLPPPVPLRRAMTW